MNDKLYNSSNFAAIVSQGQSNHIREDQINNTSPQKIAEQVSSSTKQSLSNYRLGKSKKEINKSGYIQGAISNQYNQRVKSTDRDIAQMSARVQSSYMSTKPSKMGGVNESTNFSVNNITHFNSNIGNNQGFTSSAVKQAEQQRVQESHSGFEQSEIQGQGPDVSKRYAPQMWKQSVNSQIEKEIPKSYLERDITTAGVSVIGQPINIREMLQSGTALPGQRAKLTNLMNYGGGGAAQIKMIGQGQEEVPSSFNYENQLEAALNDDRKSDMVGGFQFKNPKTAIGGYRQHLNKSIGHIQPHQEDQSAMEFKNKMLKFNVSSQLSGISQNSRGLPSVFQNGFFHDENSSFIQGDQHNQKVNFDRFQVKHQKNLSMRASSEKDKNLIFSKNYQMINNIGQRASKLKSQNQKRRAISLLSGGPLDTPMNLDGSTTANHQTPLDTGEISRIINANYPSQENMNNEDHSTRENINKSPSRNIVSKRTPGYMSHTQNTVDHRIIEQWLNDTLNDAEHYKLPGCLLKSDYQNPITRYGLDRMTLTNAGIPNDEVNHLYRAMFVYSVGFFNLVKQIVEQSKEVYLKGDIGSDGRESSKKHVTKFSIVTAVWRVFQILLEYTYRSDYQLLINKIQDDFKIEREQRDKEFNQLIQSHQAQEKRLQEIIKTMKNELEQVQSEKLKEYQQRVKLEEELLKNQKTHEDEVNLRLRFEEKLNNLHAYNRITNQNLTTTKYELDHVSKVHGDMNAVNKQLTIDLTNEKVKSQSLEQKLLYTEDKVQLLMNELGEKQKHNERLLQELSDFIDKYELANYKYVSAEKELQNEKLQVDKLDIELRHTKQLQDHYKKNYEESRTQNLTLNERLTELSQNYQIQYNELSIYRQQNVGITTQENQMQEQIEGLKEEVKFLNEKIKQQENVMSQERAKQQLLEHDLNTVKIDHELAVSKVEKINKARNDAENKMKEKTQQLRLTEVKLHDREEHITKGQRKLHEMDEKLLELEKVNTQLEKDKANLRIEFESMKRQQLDKLHSVEELLKAEKDLRIGWQERYERETRNLSTQNLEMMEMRTKMSDMESKMRHMLLQRENDRQQIDQLTQSRKEQLDQINRYAVKCEMLEKDVYALREVGKYFEKLKEKDHLGLNLTIKQLKGQITNIEMFGEEIWTRLGLSTDREMMQRSEILRLQIIIEEKSVEIEKLNQIVSDREVEVKDLRERIENQEMEASTSRNSYQILKQRVSARELEIDELKKQLAEALQMNKNKEDYLREKNKIIEQLEQEIIKIKEAAIKLSQDIEIQIGGNYPSVNQEIQCQIQMPIQKESSMTNYLPINYNPPKLPKNDLEKYELQKQQKAQKKQKERESLVQTSKLMNQLQSRFDLNGLMNSNKVRRQTESNTPTTNSVNRLKDVNQLQGGTDNSRSNLSGQNTPSKSNHYYAQSSLNVVKQVSDILSNRMANGLSQLKSSAMKHPHLSAMNAAYQIGSIEEGNNASGNDISDKSSSLRPVFSNGNQMSKQGAGSNMTVGESVNQKRGQRYSNNFHESQYPSTILQLNEGEEGGYEIESLEADEDGQDFSLKVNQLKKESGDLKIPTFSGDHHQQVTTSSKPQSKSQERERQNQIILKREAVAISRQNFASEVTSELMSQKLSPKNQSQAPTNRGQVKPSQSKQDKKERKQIKSMLRSAFS